MEGSGYKLFGFIKCDTHLVGSRQTDKKNARIYLLGTDKYGRDILSRMIYGARISLSIGLISIILTY